MFIFTANSNGDNGGAVVGGGNSDNGGIVGGGDGVNGGDDGAQGSADNGKNRDIKRNSKYKMKHYAINHCIVNSQIMHTENVRLHALEMVLINFYQYWPVLF
jgi:hypothetical protein